MRDPAIAAADLSAAFAARDLTAAMACFVADDDIRYVGSEHTESATGRDAVESMLAEVFARDEAYSWQVTTVSVREYRDCAYLLADADAWVRTDGGETQPFAYRISGLLEPSGDRWRWRYCHGCEPTGDA